MKRIQRKRTKGWRMPADTIYIGRGSRWGNRFKISATLDRETAIQKFRDLIMNCMDEASLRIWLEPLRGHDICCWCCEDENCHGDVIIELCQKLGIV